MNSVLAFHEVDDIRWFDDVVRWLQTEYRLLPVEYVSQLLAGERIHNACHITVDDGHRSFENVIFPVLKRHGIPATLFVSPRICATRTAFWFQDLRRCDEREVRAAAAEMLGMPRAALAPFSIDSVCKAMPLGDVEHILRRCRRTPGAEERPENVTAEELRTAAASGLVTIGAHTLTHPILRNECAERSEAEMVGSITELSALLDREVKYFAYPNGLPGIDFSEREERYLAKAGVELAFSTESRAIRSTDARLRAPRIQITTNESIDRIRLKLRLAGLWNLAKKLRPHGEYSERLRLSRVLCTSARGNRSA